MRILFAVFTLFVLLLMELWLGVCGIYFPVTWMGFFYFDNARYPRGFMIGTGVAGALTVDLILFRRMMLPNIFILFALMFLAMRYRDFWRASSWNSGLFAFLLLPLGYIVQFAASLATEGFSLSSFAAAMAQMTVLSPPGWIILTLLTYVLDRMQKKFKFDSPLVAVNDNMRGGMYHKSSGDKMHD